MKYNIFENIRQEDNIKMRHKSGEIESPQEYLSVG